jgi:hypothetical protein
MNDEKLPNLQTSQTYKHSNFTTTKPSNLQTLQTFQLSNFQNPINPLNNTKTLKI